MTTKLKIGLMAGMLVIASGAFAASAYTSGEVTRSANVNVVNDDTGLIALEDGPDTGLVFENSSGALAIDFEEGGADGVNTAAHFEIGDPNDANATYAFNITNLDTESHDFEMAYSGSDSEDGDSNIEFRVYDSTGSLVDTADEEGNTATLNSVGSGSTLYVVIVVDTYGLTNSTDLSGDLTISA